jgi:plasmid stabilization system protein ParE
MARIEFTQPFDDDVRRQVELLASSDEWTRVVALAQELVMLQERLATFPELGRKLLADDRQTLRRIAHGSVPYFVWYRYDRSAEVVRLAHLLHARQRTPKPRL